STVTCVMVVSFMIAVLFNWGPPLAGGRSPRNEHLRPDPPPPRGLLPGTFWYAGCKRSGSATVPRATALTSSCARGPDERRDQVDREDPDQSSAAITARRTGCSGSSRTVLPTRSPVPQSRRFGSRGEAARHQVASSSLVGSNAAEPPDDRRLWSAAMCG